MLLPAGAPRLGPGKRASVADLVTTPDLLHEMPVQEFLGLFHRPA
jgi:hypothetical protein